MRAALADQADREQIATALDDTLIVEAAAGTGKTTELVRRVVRVIQTGRAEVTGIVAVTFTEKAAGELKLRLREALEEARAASKRASKERDRLDRALGRLEEAQVSTIHGFCADLLRERPVEARIDPLFRVLTEAQAARLYDEGFHQWLEKQLADPSDGVKRSLRRPTFGGFDGDDGPVDRLRRAGWDLIQWRDFDGEWQRPPFERSSRIDGLVQLLNSFTGLLEPPGDARDNLYSDCWAARKFADEIRRTESVAARDYDRLEAGLIDLGRNRYFREARKGSGRNYRSGVLREEVWRGCEKLQSALAAFEADANADLAAALRTELRGCVLAYETAKAKAGALDFLDLLLKTRDLIRDNSGVRSSFQQRFKRIFVDEFQDTDPLQAEILLLLAADDPTATNWRQTRPVPGKLFLVGDPKQSIYRFRRADVGIYRSVYEMLQSAGARRVTLRTSFRARPHIQRAINAAFEPVMTGDPEMLQAAYVPLEPFRSDSEEQPSVVVLPVPEPYGYRRLSNVAIEKSLPDAVGAFIDWLVNDSGWKVAERPALSSEKIPLNPLLRLSSAHAFPKGEDARRDSELFRTAGLFPLLEKAIPAPSRREGQGEIYTPRSSLAPSAALGFRPGETEHLVPIQARHICLLFRRFVSFQEDMTRPYVEALEARGIPHLLVGGRSFHNRAEIETLRAALAAIEWPEDELSVFATLRGSLFAIGDEELLEYRHRIGRFHPFRIPNEFPTNLSPIVGALQLLQALHRSRNRTPVATTIAALLGATRAHVGFALEHGGEQVLANVAHVAELARRYEADGGISFRGFIDALREQAESGEAGEAPILEEGSDGVRLMTVHKAKGLEFPIVILADMTAKLRASVASRTIDSASRVCAVRLGGCAPADLIEHEGEELQRDEAEGTRVAYVAATRARDLLVVPAVGDEEREGWIQPLNTAVYPPKETRRQQIPAPGCVEFKSKDSVLIRPGGSAAGTNTVCPGLHVRGGGTEFSVVWWDPRALKLGAEAPLGIRRPELIVKDVAPDIVESGLAAYNSWRERRQQARDAGSQNSVVVRTVTQAAKTAGEAAPLTLPPVEIIELPRAADRPSGRRFGALVHAVLASVPLDGDLNAIQRVATIHGRILGAAKEEIAAAAEGVQTALAHPVFAVARRAAQQRQCHREVPIAWRDTDGLLIEGVVDLAFEEAEGWTVIDFKTDEEFRGNEPAYRRQVGMYAAAIEAAKRAKVSALLMRV
jgi:ATP-dependent exoDNAse (exonuclease V) beta subunit